MINCSECGLRMEPFNVCTRDGKIRPLKYKNTELTGCNVDVVPPTLSQSTNNRDPQAVPEDEKGVMAEALTRGDKHE